MTWEFIKEMIKGSSIVALCILVILCSCGTGMKVRKADLKPITKGYTAAIKDKASHFQGRNLRNYFPDSLHGLLNIKQADIDTVFLSFISSKQLRVSLHDLSGNKEWVFNGKFSKRGYFEIYLQKQDIQIPPLLPIFFSKRRINRVRFALTKDDHFILDHRWVMAGNFLLIGSGDGCRGQYYFNAFKSKSG